MNRIRIIDSQFRTQQIELGKKYHDRRKIILPAFSFQMLESYAEKFDSLGHQFIEKLKSFDADAELDFFHLIGQYALDVICGMLKWSISTEIPVLCHVEILNFHC